MHLWSGYFFEFKRKIDAINFLPHLNSEEKDMTKMASIFIDNFLIFPLRTGS